MISNTPKPPYYAVIFSSLMSKDKKGYKKAAKKMNDVASKQPGFLGMESVREDLGITVSYWKDLASIMNWKRNTEHMDAKSDGKKKWYESYKVRISKVEIDYGYND